MWPFLARIDAAVGEDAGAQHVLGEAAGVGLSPVARGSADDPHDGLYVSQYQKHALQRGASDHSQGFEDKNFGSSPVCLGSR